MEFQFITHIIAAAFTLIVAVVWGKVSKDPDSVTAKTSAKKMFWLVTANMLLLVLLFITCGVYAGFEDLLSNTSGCGGKGPTKKGNFLAADISSIVIGYLLVYFGHANMVSMRKASLP